METKDLPQGIVGFDFAQALVSGEYEKAYGMLSPQLKEAYSQTDLTRNYEDMIRYSRDEMLPEIHVVNNIEAGLIEADAAGGAYVSIEGDGWSEAVIITAKSCGPKCLITELVWGRP